MSEVRFNQLSEDQFVSILNHYMLPSSPIRTIELLKGRSEQLRNVQRALSSKGRHVFVYGERGVGKTSLAQTAAYQFQSSDADPIFIGCDPGTTFRSFVKTVGCKLFSTSQVNQGGKKNFALKIAGSLPNLGSLSFELMQHLQSGRIPEPDSVGDAVALIIAVASCHSSQPVVVIDEFDRITATTERALFGDFVKQIADLEAPIKLVFCGVGSSVDELFSEHKSCFRYLATVHLERLQLGPLMEILQSAAAALGVDVPEYYKRKIAVISDGFPHYTHLIGTQLFWEVFENVHRIPEGRCEARVGTDEYASAISRSINEVDRQLQQIYDQATKKYNDEYEHLLWAMADHPDLIRRSSDVYASYVRIMEQLSSTPIERDKFNSRMNALKKKSHGRVLLGSRQGWYQFREPVIRGFCRLRAQSRGVVLDRDHALDSVGTESKVVGEYI